MTMEELMSDFELKNFHKGEIVKGKVVSVKNDEIVVNIGHFADGIIPKNEISNDDEFDINSLSIGIIQNKIAVIPNKAVPIPISPVKLFTFSLMTYSIAEVI